MEMQTETYGDEINLLDYVKVILRHKIMLAVIMIIVVATTIIISLIMTPTYEAKAVIAPATKTGEGSGAGLLAAQLGISVPSSSSMSEIVNLLKSNILKEEVIKKHNLLPVMLGERDLRGKSEGQKTWKGIKYLRDNLKISPNQKDNSIQVSMQFKDPRVAADIVNYTLVELTDHMSNEARRVADTNKKYLESQVDKTSDPFIRTKIYALIAQQIETAMMAEVKENFAFKILDPPRVPYERIKPKRVQMAVIAFVLSLFLGVFVAFGTEYWRNHRGELRAEKRG